MRLQAAYSGYAGMMHYCMGNDSALDRIDAIRGLVAYDLDRAEVLGGREMRRYSRTVSHWTPSLCGDWFDRSNIINRSMR